MATSPVDSTRVDPYKDFKFRVKWDAGGYVAGVSKVSALTATVEPAARREGRDPSPSHESPGRTRHEPITLERGVTHDVEFAQWANGISGRTTPSAGQHGRDGSQNRRDLTIDVFDEAGQRVISYRVHRAWVSELAAHPGLAADASATLIQSIRIEHEGCEAERDE